MNANETIAGSSNDNNSHCNNKQVVVDEELSSNIVELNIGGINYTTTKTTLLRYEDSMLALIVSGDYPTSKDKDGRIFIDRDGNLFSFILNYLRTNKLFIDNINTMNFNDYEYDNSSSLTLLMNKLLSLKIEADFYRIDNLINDIDELLLLLRDKLARSVTLNENRYQYYQYQVQLAKETSSTGSQATSSTSQSLTNSEQNAGYHIDLIEHNFLNTNTKRLQIIAHYDVFKMLPLLEDDLNLLLTIKQRVSDSEQQQMPYRVTDGHCWYLGNDCFEMQNISYLTRAQIGHILLKFNSKLLSSSIAYLNSINNNTYNLSIMDKWFVLKDAVEKYLTNMCTLQQKALPPGRTAGYIDWDPQNNDQV